MIEKKPFRLYNDSEKLKHKVISIKINEQEERELKDLMMFLFTDKKSVAIKQAISITLKHLKSNTTLKTLDLICNNVRRAQKNLRKDLEIKRYKQKNE